MTNSSGLFLLIGIIGGFIGGTLVTRNYWISTYRIYTEEIVKQYSSLLNKFGIYKNDDGLWYRDG